MLKFYNLLLKVNKTVLQASLVFFFKYFNPCTHSHTFKVLILLCVAHSDAVFLSVWNMQFYHV